jgi:hypothetical protein
LNGDLRPEVTPTKLANLPLDRELHVKLTKDGFETFRTSTKLSESRPFEEIVAELSKSTATVLLRVEPLAAVWVDGKMWKGERTKVDGLTPARSTPSCSPPTATPGDAQGDRQRRRDPVVYRGSLEGGAACRRERHTPATPARRPLRVNRGFL